MSAISKIARKLNIRPEDATEDVRIVVRKSDIARANRLSPDTCVLARAACRCVSDVSEAFFYKSTAWLRQVSDDGQEKLVRFIPSLEAAKQIEKFDKTGQFDTGVFILHAPKASKTLEAVAVRAKRRAYGVCEGPKVKVKRAIKARTRATWAEI